MERRELLAALAAAPQGVSGARLAARFGVSRSAVWKAMAGLRDEGLMIAAQAGRGYRLAQPYDPIDATALRRALERALPQTLDAVEVVWRIDSTSSELKRRQARGDLRCQLLVAEGQSAGRGRMGRVWTSPPACNLYFSLGWRMARPAAALGGLSLALGIVVVEALEGMGVDALALKWPNDIIRDGRKLGGLLVELGGELAGPTDLVVGLGLNVRMPCAAAAAIDQPWSDLGEVAGLPARTILCAVLAAALAQALSRYDREGFAPFRTRFERMDALCGRAVTIVAGSRRQVGTAAGVDAEGGLRVRHHDGERVHRGGEVSVR